MFYANLFPLKCGSARRGVLSVTLILPTLYLVGVWQPGDMGACCPRVSFVVVMSFPVLACLVCCPRLSYAVD